MRHRSRRAMTLKKCDDRRGRRGWASGRRRRKGPPNRARTTCYAPKTTGRCEPRGLACRSLAFTSYYVYSPHGEGAAAQASRQLCERVKESNPVWLARYAGVVYRAAIGDPRLLALFSGGAVLVPVPGSALSGDAPWAASTLAVALRDVGLAHAVWMGLRRRAAV